MVHSTRKKLSTQVPLLKAARHPRGTPTSTAHKRAILPTFAETGNISLMMLRTGRFFCILMEVPKSPCARFFRYLPSWIYLGWSSPYFAFSAWIVASDGVFSDNQGLPGIAFIRKNVILATSSNVTNAIQTLRTVYFVIFYTFPLYLLSFLSILSIVNCRQYDNIIPTLPH